MRVICFSIYIDYIISYHFASSGFNVTYGVVMRAAAVMIFTTSSRFNRAADPAKAEVTILIHAAAGASLWAWEVVIADGGGGARRRRRRRVHRRWRRGPGIRRVLAFLVWI